MNDYDKNWRIAMALGAAIIFALIGLAFFATFQHNETARKAMEKGYIQDRGEWRKLQQ